MTFAAVTTTGVSATAKTFTYAPPSGSAAGQFVLCAVLSETSADFATAMSSSNVTWSVLVAHTTIGSFSLTLFIGELTSTASATVTVTLNTGTPTMRVSVSPPFSTTAGFANVSLVTSGTVNAGTAFPSLSPTAAGQMYWGWCFAASTDTAGHSTGFTYWIDGNGNVHAWDASVTSTAALAPTAGTSGDALTGMAVILKENVSHPAAAALSGSGTLHAGGTVRIPSAAAMSGAGTLGGTRPAVTNLFPGSSRYPGSGLYPGALVSSLPPLATLQDAFTGSTLSDLWVPFGSGVTVGGGELALACTTAYNWVNSASSYDLTGSHVFAKLTPDQGGSGYECGLFLGDAAGVNGYSLGYEQGNLAALTWAGGSVTSTVAETPYDPLNHAWVRISEAAGTLTYSVSPDGLNWTSLWTSDESALSSLGVTVQIFTGYFAPGSVDGTSFVAQVNIAQSAPLLETLQDSFATDDLAELWAHSTGTVTVSGGQCAIASDLSYDSALSSTDAYNLTGSHMLARIIPPANLQGTTWFQVDPVSGGAAGISVGYNALSAYWATPGGDYTFGPVFPAYDPVGMAWWRVREASGTLFWEYGPDGSSWTTLWSLADPAIDLTSVVAQIGSGIDTGSAGTAFVDSFNVVTSVVSGAASLSGSGTLGAGGTVLVPGAAALTGSGTLTATGAKRVPAAVAMSGSGSLSAAGRKAVPSAASLAGAGTLNAGGSVTLPAAAALSGTGTLGGTAGKSVPGAAALSGSGSLGAAGQKALPGAAALAGAGSLSAPGHKTLPAAAVLAGSGTLGGTGAKSLPAAAAMSGSGALSASPAKSVPSAAALAGSGTLASAGIKTAPAAAAWSGSGSLTSTGLRSARGSAAFSGTGTFLASQSPLARASAALAGAGALTAGAQKTVPGAAALAGAGVLSAAGTETLPSAAALSGAGTLTAGGRKTVPGAGALTGTGSLSAGASKSVPAAAALAGAGTLGGGAGKAVPASAALSGAGTLGGHGQKSLPGAASLTGQGSLSAAVSVAVPAAAKLTGAGEFLASQSPVAHGAAALAGTGALGAAGAKAVPVAAALAGSGALRVAGGRAVSASASLAGAGSLGPAGTKKVPGAAVMAGAGSLAAAAQVTARAAAVLAGAGGLSAGGAKAVPAAAALTGTGSMSGASPRSRGLLMASGIV